MIVDVNINDKYIREDERVTEISCPTLDDNIVYTRWTLPRKEAYKENFCAIFSFARKFEKRHNSARILISWFSRFFLSRINLINF